MRSTSCILAAFLLSTVLVLAAQPNLSSNESSPLSAGPHQFKSQWPNIIGLFEGQTVL